MPTGTVDETLARARSALAMPTLYWLGEGGQTVAEAPGQRFDPQAALRALKVENPDKYAAYQAGLQRTGLGLDQLPRAACDCSGLVAWCLGVPRHPIAIAGKSDGWFNTGAIHADALGRQQCFTVLAQAMVGALLVFPANAGVRPVGHVAIISETDAGRATRIIHCAPRNFEREPPSGLPRNAIAETDCAIFDAAADTLVVGWKAFAPA